MLFPFPDQDHGWEEHVLRCPVSICEMRESRGFREGHRAVDLEAPIGEPIRASHSGIVEHAGWWCELKPCAIRVVIRGYDGTRTGYFHLQENLLVEVGDRVYRGQRIGRVGMTGRTSFPHVHMWVEQAGRRVNPCDVLDIRVM
jgi:murein DD-endopeptidase MepM/ murein hydrolase activator NlpD